MFHNFWDHQGLERGNAHQRRRQQCRAARRLAAHHRHCAYLQRDSVRRQGVLFPPSELCQVFSSDEETSMTTAGNSDDRRAGRSSARSSLIAGLRNFAHFSERKGAGHQLWLAVAGAAAGDRFCRAVAWRSLAHLLASGRVDVSSSARASSCLQASVIRSISLSTSCGGLQRRRSDRTSLLVIDVPRTSSKSERLMPHAVLIFRGQRRGVRRRSRRPCQASVHRISQVACNHAEIRCVR